MATPKLISRGIHRLWDPGVGEAGAPSSKRVIEDCDRAWSAMFTVYQNKGAIVAGLVDRNGNRYSKQGKGKQGGRRIKSEMKAPG